MRVLFPQPLGPLIATNSFRAISSDTPSRACTVRCPLVYSRLRFFRMIKPALSATEPFRANQAAETNNNAGRATHLWLSVPSELETRAKLHSAKIVGSGGYSSKSPISGPEVRESKALVIEGVEHFGAYLEYLTFADLELLGKRSVQICNAIAS